MERRTDNNIDRRCEKKKERERERFGGVLGRLGYARNRGVYAYIRSLISSRGNRYTGLDNLLFSPFLLSS